MLHLSQYEDYFKSETDFKIKQIYMFSQFLSLVF